MLHGAGSDSWYWQQPGEAARLAAEEASATHVRPQSSTPFEEPWPLDGWPSVPTRCIVGRRDRLFPLAMQRRVIAERLGVRADEMETGHLLALGRPAELADHRTLIHSASRAHLPYAS